MSSPLTGLGLSFLVKEKSKIKKLIKRYEVRKSECD
jgi:hypothetical protein